MAFLLQHRKITEHALSQLVNDKKLTPTQLKILLWAVMEVDLVYGHPKHSGHRLSKWQDVFEKYGGGSCKYAGGEEQAKDFLERALKSNDSKESLKHLGYVIHFVQDALCPEHIFPFSERRWKILSPHVLFEGWMACKHFWDRSWKKVVRDAPVIEIESPEYLRAEMVRYADLVASEPVDYLRQDGAKIGQSVPLWGWRVFGPVMEWWLEKAASLTKGVAELYLREKAS